MYTQCPHCQTCFRIAEAHLKVANGKVRCGSCQEVFDATQHLFKNLTDREPITDYQRQPAPTPSQQPAPPPEETDNIDLSNTATTPSPKAVEKILREREKAPAQDQFMQSMVGNDRYNDLDNMNVIDLPGEIDFGDSIIKFPDEAKAETQTKTPAAEPDKAQPRTPYEDIESKDAPTTTAEHESLENFFAEVDSQLDEDKSKSQLDKDIDELLAFAKGLDVDTDLNKPTSNEPAAKESSTTPPKDTGINGDFDLQAIADFEKELDTTHSDAFRVEQAEKNSKPNEQAGKIAESRQAASSTKAEAPPATEEPPPAPQVSKQSTTRDTPAETETDITAGLPEGDEDIPRALRRSLEMLDQTPRRSLGKTVLMSLLILILLGGLGFQIVLFRNVELVHTFPSLRPELTQLCNRIPCRYSGKVDVSQIKLINRDVRSDPKQANALLISATFVDKAPFDQPYPIIKITLYDLGGNVVASRRFTPKEYLQKMYNRFLLMESGTPVHITLAVLDPGKDAINFEFSFL